MQESLARIHEHETELNAFAHLDIDGAAAQAEALDEELSRTGPRGPLHGIPVAIKDLIDVAKMPTGAGSRLLEGHIAARDAPVIRRLRDAGAIVLGKTHTHELAYGVFTRGTRNPWDPTRTPGGSSGGSAVAVAAGFAAAALGTDTAGSIRIPSAFCGVCGLKPRHGTLPMDDIVPLSWSLDSCGPVARTAADLRLLWETLARQRPPPSAPASLRVGVPDLSRVAEVDPEIRQLVERTYEIFEGAGCETTAVSLGRFDRWDKGRGHLLMAEALAAHIEAGWYPGHSEAYTEETRGNLEAAAKVPAWKLAAGLRALEPLKDELAGVFAGADVLLLPTVPIPPPTWADIGSDDSRKIKSALTLLCGPINLCPLAAISVPCGFTSRGLPVGLQIVARTESTALDAAELYQESTAFHGIDPFGPGPRSEAGWPRTGA